jgi:NADH dehydrogenase (ubiquinone) Fe-S protein 1
MLRIVSSVSRPTSVSLLGVASELGSFIFCSVLISPDRRNIASTSARQAEITLTVDGKEVTVPQGW